jgi:cytoskeletal protein RodZ
VAEHYVRPPLLAVEPPSPRAARWRFRLVVGLIFLVVLGGLALLLFTVILSNSEGNPGFNPQGLARSKALSSTVASVPPSGAGVSVS